MNSNDRFILDVYGAAQECSPAEFNDYSLDELRKIVYFDSAGVGSFALMPDKRVAIQSLHLRSVPLERFRDRGRAVGGESLNRDGTLNSRDAAVTRAFAQRGTSVVVDVAKQFFSPEVLDYCRKYETAHSLSLVSATMMQGMIPTIALWRARRQNPYLAQQSADATQLVPHLFQAMSINRRLAMLGEAGKPGETTALASPQGQLYFVEPETVRLLQLEWPQWSPPFLPYVVMDALRSSREFAFAGAAIQVRAQHTQSMIALRIAARDVRSKGLSAAEYRVARLAVTGLTYKEIARELGVSPATVRNQLHAVYGKLGVSSKTALAAMLPAS